MKIKQKRMWSWYHVAKMCCDECYYTLGTYDDYNKVMNYVEEHPNPTDEDIYKVAKDIQEHSFDKEEPEEEPVTDIMHKLANNVVRCLYEVEE